jgi:hypothetical protein
MGISTYKRWLKKDRTLLPTYLDRNKTGNLRTGMRRTGILASYRSGIVTGFDSRGSETWKGKGFKILAA